MTKKEFLRITKELGDKITENRKKMATATVSEKRSLILQNHEMMMKLDRIYAAAAKN